MKVVCTRISLVNPELLGGYRDERIGRALNIYRHRCLAAKYFPCSPSCILKLPGIAISQAPGRQEENKRCAFRDIPLADGSSYHENWLGDGNLQGRPPG